MRKLRHKHILRPVYLSGLLQKREGVKTGEKWMSVLEQNLISDLFSGLVFWRWRVRRETGKEREGRGRGRGRKREKGEPMEGRGSENWPDPRVMASQWESLTVQSKHSAFWC